MKTDRTLFRPLSWALAAFVLGVVFAGNFGRLKTAPAAQGHHRVLYQCPMHPEIIQDHPGFCPICHMRLEKVEDDGDSDADAQIPALQAENAEHVGPAVAGKAGFSLSPERQQLIGVRTTAVEIQPIALTLRMPGLGAAGGHVSAQLLDLDRGTVKRGMRARLLGPDGASAEARISGVDPEVDSSTRNFGVTLRTTGPADWLEPGLFCQVLVDAGLGRHLAVPEEAVLDTGERQIVFVEDRPGHFEPRLVTLGEAGDDLVEIKHGIKAGEQVVTSANFLIDSESRFRAALNQF